MEKVGLALLGLIVAVAVVFGIGTAIAATDDKSFEPTEDGDCLSVTFKENHPFSPDYNHSGLYCKVEGK